MIIGRNLENSQLCKLIRNPWANDRLNNIIKKVKNNYLDTNGNEHTAYQGLQDAAKVVLRGKFFTVNTYRKIAQITPPGVAPQGSRKGTN